MTTHKSDGSYLEVHESQGIATVTINRPEVRNSLCETTLNQLQRIFIRLQQQAELRAVILKGSGRVFCSGGDVTFFQNLLSQGGDSRIRSLKRYIGVAHDAILAMAGIHCPVITSIQGAAAGYGMSLACMSDIIVADINSRFIPAYSALGSTPDGGLSLSLPAAIGKKRAFEVLALNTIISAKQASGWGLVNHIAAGDNGHVDDISQSIASRLAEGASIANRGLKKLLNPHSINELATHLDKELESFIACALTTDFDEGVKAFIEKRTPVFL